MVCIIFFFSQPFDVFCFEKIGKSSESGFNTLNKSQEKTKERKKKETTQIGDR